MQAMCCSPFTARRSLPSCRHGARAQTPAQAQRCSEPLWRLSTPGHRLGHAQRQTQGPRHAAAAALPAGAAAMLPLVISHSNVMATTTMALPTLPRVAVAVAGVLIAVTLAAKARLPPQFRFKPPASRSAEATKSALSSYSGQTCGRGISGFASVTSNDLSRYLDLADMSTGDGGTWREAANQTIAKLATYSVYLAVKESQAKIQSCLQAYQAGGCQVLADPDEDARPDPIMQLVACKLGCTLPEGDVSQARHLPSDALTVQQLAKEVATLAALEQVSAIVAAVEDTRPTTTLPDQQA